MNPNTLSIQSKIKYLKGVGPQRANILAQNNIHTVEDLIRYYPRKYLDRTNLKKISQLKIGEKAVIMGRIKSFSMKKTKNKRYFQLTVMDDFNGYINCLWFNSLSWIVDKFNIGEKIALFGKVEFYQTLRFIHPEFDILDDEDDPINTGCIVPLYSSNNLLKKIGLDSRGIRKLILRIFKDLNEDVEDYFNLNIIKEQGILKLNDALQNIHIPENKDAIKNAIYRLKFGEHFFLQLIKALSKKQRESMLGKSYSKLGEYAKSIYKNLNFELTNAQIKVLREIRTDFKSKKSMNRLIQGDVGCGKTIVSILAGAIIVGNNAQVVIIAPTEILAEQHFKTFNKYFSPYKLKCKLLISNLLKRDKEKIYKELKEGNIKIIIGTHALIQERVAFKNLGLVIIDEQHKFGVDQRKKLIHKGQNPNILAMTATPIPRTLAFTIHGDMEISWIDEMPKNRQKINTFCISGKENISNVYEIMKSEMSKGNQCYIVYPIISESEKLDLKDAESNYLKLKNKEFKKFHLGFIHGKLKRDEKDQLMKDFIDCKINCLIATTVVEVGVDNPNATIMVIENAERFGLTQLHQLRGRIGRGEKKSTCYLIQRKKTENSNQRLHIMETVLDGFQISDEDLKLRGPGDFFGTQQHGYIKLGLINFYSDGEIIKRARKKAFEIIEEDPKICMPENILIKKELLKNYKNMLEFINIS